MKRACAATAATSFQRAWRRHADRLSGFGRAGRWAVALGQERPRLAEGPLFGEQLAEVTATEASVRAATRRPARRAGVSAAAPPPMAPPATAVPSAQRRPRRGPAAELSAVRDLPAAVPGEQIARWAGTPAPVAATSVRRRPQPIAGESQPRGAGARQVAEHRRSLAARASGGLTVERSAGAPADAPPLPARRRRRRSRSATGVGPPTAPGAAGQPEAGIPQATAGASEAVTPDFATAKIHRRTAPSPPGSSARGHDPWTTPVSGARASRSVLEAAAHRRAPAARIPRAAKPPGGRGPQAPAPLAPQEPGGVGTRLQPELPPTSRDRSDAPEFDPGAGRAAPFTPIAPYPTSSAAASTAPLGPFPGSPAIGPPIPEPPSGASPAQPSQPGLFVSSSADELSELAFKIERILADEARRHGIDV